MLSSDIGRQWLTSERHCNMAMENQRTKYRALVESFVWSATKSLLGRVSRIIATQFLGRKHYIRIFAIIHNCVFRIKDPWFHVERSNEKQ